MTTYSLKVIDIIDETVEAKTICFKQPMLRKISYKAGQYITLIFRINGRRYIRPYSLSSAPGVDSTLNITIKRVYGGIVSNHIFDKVNIGDVIEVIEPMGDFIIEKIPCHIEKGHLVFWGSGSGIAPLISLLKYVLNEADGNNITLVYGNRNFETTIFQEQIKQLEHKHPSKFKVLNFHSKTAINKSINNVIEGRIDPTRVLTTISKDHDIKHTVHFICGPIGLKESIKSKLKHFGVSDDNILSEDFEITRDPEEFVDIFTQNVLLTNNDQECTFEVTKGKSILEAGLDASLELTYSCQTGNCLLCRATLLDGFVKTIGIKKNPDELHKDECLLCCSFPLTNNVKILVNS